MSMATLETIDHRLPWPDDNGNFDPISHIVRRINPPNGFGYDLAMMECGHQLAVITHDTPRARIETGTFPCIRCGVSQALTADAIEILAPDMSEPF